MDEENESRSGSDSDDGSKIHEEENSFRPHNNYASDEDNNNKQDGFFEDW